MTAINDTPDWYRQPEGFDAFDAHEAINALSTRFEQYTPKTAGWLSNLAHNVYGRVVAFPAEEVDSTSVRMLIEGFLTELHSPPGSGSEGATR